MRIALTLFLLPGQYVVCRLAAEDEVPAWALAGSFFSITRTPGELSVVCSEEDVPAEVPAEHGWRVMGVRGPLEFTLTGILADLVGPLAEAEISIFAVSTYETDYLLVKEAALEKAIGVLARAGHKVLRGGQE